MIREFTARPTTERTPDELKSVITEPWEILEKENYGQSTAAAFYLLKAGSKRFIIAIVDVETIYLGTVNLFYFCDKPWRRDRLPSRGDLQNFPYVSCQTGRPLAVHEIYREHGLRGPWVRSEAEAIKNYDGLVGVGKTHGVPEPFSAEFFEQREAGRKRAQAKRDAIKKMKDENRKQEKAYWKAVGKIYQAEDAEIAEAMRKNAG